jgi:hypothetical protein
LQRHCKVDQVARLARSRGPETVLQEYDQRPKRWKASIYQEQGEGNGGAPTAANLTGRVEWQQANLDSSWPKSTIEQMFSWVSAEASRASR